MQVFLWAKTTQHSAMSKLNFPDNAAERDGKTGGNNLAAALARVHLCVRSRIFRTLFYYIIFMIDAIHSSLTALRIRKIQHARIWRKTRE